MTSQENDMQTRIDQYTTALRQQYTQLEVTVSKYKAQLSSLGGSTSSSTSSSSSSGSSGSSSTG
jgi:flagellar capping protein FliD